MIQNTHRVAEDDRKRITCQKCGERPADVCEHCWWDTGNTKGVSFFYHCDPCFDALYGEAFVLVEKKSNPEKILQILGIKPYQVHAATFESCSFVVALSDMKTCVEVCFMPKGISGFDSPGNPLFQSKSSRDRKQAQKEANKALHRKYDILQVETALCIWEAMLAEFGKPPVERDPGLSSFWEDGGAVAMRHTAIELADHAIAVWEKIPDEQKELVVPYDWEFIPDFVSEVDWRGDFSKMSHEFMALSIVANRLGERLSSED